MQKSNGQMPGEVSGDESLTPDQIQRIIQVGEECNRVTQTPVISMAFNQVLNQKMNELMNSLPKETQKRESLYHQHVALVDVWEQLINAVKDAKRALEEQHEAHNPNNQQQEYLNNQGFGVPQ